MPPHTDGGREHLNRFLGGWNYPQDGGTRPESALQCPPPLVGWAARAYYRANLTAAMQEAQRILAVSHATRRAICDYAPWHDAKVRVTYNGFDPSRIYPMDTRGWPTACWRRTSSRGRPLCSPSGKARRTSEFIPIKPLAATDSSAPGSCAGHNRVPSPDRGRPPSTNGSGLSQCGSA